MKLPPTYSKKKNCINAVIETIQGSRNKYTYDSEEEYFKLNKILPAGTSFPLDFGFIPYTLGQDGDPLDVMVISDAPFVTGCVVESRVVGILLVRQVESKGVSIRNDRIIAVAS